MAIDGQSRVRGDTCRWPTTMASAVAFRKRQLAAAWTGSAPARAGRVAGKPNNGRRARVCGVTKDLVAGAGFGILKDRVEPGSAAVDRKEDDILAAPTGRAATASAASRSACGGVEHELGRARFHAPARHSSCAARTLRSVAERTVIDRIPV